MQTRNQFGFGWSQKMWETLKTALTSDSELGTDKLTGLDSYDFETYRLKDHFVTIIKAKTDGTPNGPEEFQPFPSIDHPALPVTMDNYSAWIVYLVTKFKPSKCDAFFVLPIKDCGRDDVDEDLSLFSDEQFSLWELQLSVNLHRLTSSVSV